MVGIVAKDVLLLLAFALQGAHAPTAETEGVSVDAPGTFVIGNRDNDGRMSLIEMVKPPETVDNWSELISVSTVMHATEGNTLNRIYPIWRDGYRETCPGPNETLTKGTVDGKPAIKALFHCPVDPKTGKSENMAIIFIQGDVNLMSVQFAFRRPMTNADNAMITKVIRTLKVCDSRDERCFGRRPSGFLPNG